MFRSFFRIAFRVFIRNRFHTLINIFGLAIGLSFSITIFLYTYKEISYDRFHNNAKRIYRVAVNGKIAENKLNLAVTSTPLAGTMIREIPEVEDVVRVARFGAWLVRNDSIRYNEDNIIFADPHFFRMFSFPLIHGEPDQVLTKPNSIVLSEQAAKRYFGAEDPLGKMLRIENDTTYYRVTGVMQDIPENSHIHFDMVGALVTFDKMLNHDKWVANYLYTYFLAREGSSLDNIKNGLNTIVSEYVIPDYQKLLNLEDRQSFSADNYYKFVLQPLTSIHLKSDYSGEFEPAGKILYVNLLIVLAIFILILSCMNFIGMVTAQSADRAREVGIRKIAGSGRRTLVNQFLIESSLLAFLAMMLALLFTELSLPAISRYIGLNLSLGQLLNSAGLTLMVALIVVIGVVSGLYPALYLSAYNPQSVLRNRLDEFPDKGRFRKALAVFQIFIAVGAIAMMLIIMLQFRFLLEKDRGYDTKDLLIIRRPDALTNKLEDYKKDILRNRHVLSVTNATSAMGGGYPRYPYYLEGSPVARNFSTSSLLVSYAFDTTYGIKMVNGRFFDRAVPSDSFACVINETAARQIGLKDPAGKTLVQLSDKSNKKLKYRIIGVTKDFHFETLENPIRPLIMVLMPGNFEGYLAVRLAAENQDSTIQYIKKIWENYTTAYPFVYYFLDNDRQNYYQPVRMTARIFTMLSLVTVLMACLSLFALVSFSYNREKREIGIRKTIGAGTWSIVFHRAGEIVLLVISASVAAWIGVYFLASNWLNDYAYHINLNIWYFLTATCILSMLSFAAVYYHTLLAAKANPGEALKYE